MKKIREMKTGIKFALDCYPCFVRQIVIAVRFGTDDEALREEVVKDVIGYIPQIGTEKTPAHAATWMHRRIRQKLGNDPFKRIKSEYNLKALELYPSLKELVGQSDDPLLTASRLAIAGNIIDFGLYTSVDIKGTVERALNKPLQVDDYESFKKTVVQTKDILYLLDNTGEAVFDRILIETLTSMGKKVTAVAKGSAIINDCTIEDAKEAGLDIVCEVMDNGSDAVGTILEETSPDFNARFRGAGMIISKGQGNFETLCSAEGFALYFLFQSKCEVVSSALGLTKGSMLLLKGL